MAVYVALLRAINLGARNRVAMPDLRRVLDEAGFTDVQTHLHTGNVVVGSRRRSPEAVQHEVETTLRESLALEVDVVVRRAAAIAAVAAAHPLDAPGTGPKALHVGFLKAAPDAAAIERLQSADFGDDRFELRGTELFLRYPDGLGRSRMSGAFFERALRVPMTIRGWNVVTHLAEMAHSAG